MTDRLAGILLGTAVGDALGLPVEGLSARRARRWTLGVWRHRFLCGYGMASDDTEHTLFVAQSLLRQPSDANAFQRRLAWHLRWWFAGLPAGIGKATAIACMKLWLGWPPDRSGVFSAGNGPAMRSAIIGGYFCLQPELLREFVRVSTQLTHSDPKAVVGAEAVASVAAWAVKHDPSEKPDCGEIVCELIRVAADDNTWITSMRRIETAYSAGDTVASYAKSLGLVRGITGYIYHTVPVAIYAWLRHYGNFKATLEAALDCGGDADTVGAITGALAGATVGVEGIPPAWIDRTIDWPRSTSLLRTVAARLSEQQSKGLSLGEVNYFWPAVVPRNMLFLAVVLLHGFRRLLPPW